jgi:hypothetical protein
MTAIVEVVQWPIAFTVEHGKCLEMARALRTTRDEYTTAERLTAVPTFTAILNHWGFSGADVVVDLGLDIRRVLHGSEEFEYPNGPLKEGQRVAGVMGVVSRESRVTAAGRTMNVIALETELKDVDSGEVAVRVKRTLLELAPEPGA